MSDLYVLLGLSFFVAVLARAVELYFTDRREAREKDKFIQDDLQRKFSELLAAVSKSVENDAAHQEFVVKRLSVFQAGLENAISQLKTAFSEMDAARQKANAANVLNKLQGGKRPLP